MPVPIELVSTQTIGATLGQDALDRGIAAAIFAFAVIALFMIVWYRLPGLISVVSLAIYLSIMLALIKIIPITLTAGGIAGLILSLGIAVDANVLIFERLKEELRAGKKVRDAVLEGFGRAWTSIRDSNLSTIISSLILFWFGTAMIKGFAINLTIGVVVSMFTAITVTRTFLMALNAESSPLMRFLYSSGFSKGQQKNEK